MIAKSGTRRIFRNNLKGLISGILAILVFNGLIAQNTQPGSSRKEALDAFSRGDYLKAYEEFSGLLETYPKDPLYKYYSGACLVGLKREPGKAEELLRDALNSSLEIRKVPGDAWFYLGRSQQMSGEFRLAISSFERFTTEVGKKAARQLGVQQYIEECGKGIGRIEEVETAKVKEPLPQELDKKLSEALRYQAASDSLNKVAEGFRNNYAVLPDSLKPAAKRKISETGSQADNYLKLADEKVKNPDSLPAGRSGIPPADGKKALMPESQPEAVAVQVNPGMKRQPEPVFSKFEVIKDPAKVREQKIEIDPELPPGLIYKIQMGVFSKPVEPAVFKGITPVYGIRIKASVMIRYFAGMFRRFDDANKALLDIKRLGFKDSFIVAASDGTVVSLERAAVMEKEWGSKPLFVRVSAPEDTSQVEAAPLTLSFRVELLRSDKPVSEEVEESYRKLAGNKRFEILSPVDRQYVYLIGNFITFESASEYADLLNRNGYRDARVVAYLGNREIPVETAKQLIEKIE